MWVWTQYMYVLLADSLTRTMGGSPTVGPLEACYLGLSVAPTPAYRFASLIADITEANYDGYARQEVVWYPPYVSTQGPVTVEGASLFFAPTDAVLAATITGVFLATAPSGGLLLGGAPLAVPYPILANPLTALTIVPAVQLPLGAVWGGVTQSS
jgi:hypothetical protein